MSQSKVLGRTPVVVVITGSAPYDTKVWVDGFEIRNVGEIATKVTLSEKTVTITIFPDILQSDLITHEVAEARIAARVAEPVVVLPEEEDESS